MKGRSFLTLMDHSPEEIRYLLDLSAELKKSREDGARGSQVERRAEGGSEGSGQRVQERGKTVPPGTSGRRAHSQLPVDAAPTRQLARGRRAGISRLKPV